jgi:hypothetical protein
MADANGSPEILGFTISDHQLTHGQYQSGAELNTNTSTRFRKTMTDRG